MSTTAHDTLPDHVRPTWSQTTTRVRVALIAVLVSLSVVAPGGGPAAADTPLFGNASDFVGTWRNVDDDTRSITKVVISPGAGIVPVYVRVFASCGSGECDWKKVDGHWGGSGTTTIKATVLSKDDNNWFVWATRKVTLRLESGDVMSYQVRTDYVDPSRQDRVSTGQLARS